MKFLYPFKYWYLDKMEQKAIMSSSVTSEQKTDKKHQIISSCKLHFKQCRLAQLLILLIKTCNINFNSSLHIAIKPMHRSFATFLQHSLKTQLTLTNIHICGYWRFNNVSKYTPDFSDSYVVRFVAHVACKREGNDIHNSYQYTRKHHSIQLLLISSTRLTLTKQLILKYIRFLIIVR